MWELVIFHAVFTMCVIAYARGVSSPQGIRNSDIYPFEALPHHNSLSIGQNYFTVKIMRPSLNALHVTLALTVISNKSSFFLEIRHMTCGISVALFKIKCAKHGFIKGSIHHQTATRMFLHAFKLGFIHTTHEIQPNTQSGIGRKSYQIT